MKMRKITAGGQISLPAGVRRRWQTRSVAVEDLGDRVVIRPLPNDPILAARGAMKDRTGFSTALRAKARSDEAAAEDRR